MPKYRKKPVEIEAWQLPPVGTPINPNIVHFISQGQRAFAYEWRDGTVAIETLEGTVNAQPGDWIIRGTKGEL